MSLNDKILVKLNIGTFATLVAGLYCSYSAVNPIGIPEYIWIELAEKLRDYMTAIDDIDEFIKYNLLIIPKPMCSEVEIEEYKENTVYYERENGNIILIITFEV